MLTFSDLDHLRKIFCTCESDQPCLLGQDGELCSCYRVDGLTDECMDNCPTFYKMWAELLKFLEEIQK